MDINQQLLLVDNDDTFLGSYADRLHCHSGKGLHHRAFVVVVYNNKNEILLQKRKHSLWDGYWDVSAISHVLHLSTHDESYEEAAYRALQKEIGIPEIPIKNIGGFNYYAKEKVNYCENEYCAILIGSWDGKLHPNLKEVYEVKWVPLLDFVKDTQINPKIYAPWTLLTAKLLPITLS